VFNPADRLLNELHHAARLGAKQRGEIAELAFMRKAATLGFAVAKPWGDSDRYDVILRSGKIFWRVQIKSAWFVSGRRTHYHIRTTGGGNSCYSAAEIDFLVAYIFSEDAWYVFPVAMIASRKAFCVSPRSKRSWFAEYRDAWDLMRPPETVLVQPDTESTETL
jgi:hypothetical protein